MPPAPPHPREKERLLALQSYGVLDTPHDEAFDALTALAARLCDAPIALVSLVDDERQWFKSHHGFEPRQTPREQAVCGYALLQEGPFIVPDTMKDERFIDNPLCCGIAGVRFYAGIPLVGQEGLPLGTFCVIDTKPRPEGLTDQQLQDLRTIAQQAFKLLELGRSVERHRTSLKESVHRTKNVIAVASAIAARTITESGDLRTARNRLAERLNALSHAQSFLLTAAHGGAPLRALIERQLVAFGDDDPRFTLDGDDVAVSGEAAEGIGLAVHELATNAIKYGALSVPAGEVQIGWWRRNDGGVKIEWREKGGPPPVIDKPLEGFGSIVVGALATQKIGGAAKLEFLPDGACWTAQVAAHQVVRTEG